MPRSSGGSAPPPTAPSLLPPTPGGSSNPSPTPALVSTRALFLRRFPSVDAPLGFEPARAASRGDPSTARFPVEPNGEGSGVLAPRPLDDPGVPPFPFPVPFAVCGLRSGARRCASSSSAPPSAKSDATT